ncbi:MAG TPA: prenyltransferase/squalene oxidase repeat-containing protein [Herpetosiphonaceae bacterium]
MRQSAYVHFAVEEMLQLNQPQTMQPTAYDTAWVARLTNEDGSLAYPDALQWVLERQHPDGSWGGKPHYLHDRILSTLAVVLLLARHGNRVQDHQQRKAGERYIWQNCGRLHYDPHATIGFELLLPAMLQEAQELGIDVPYRQFQHINQARAKKLALLPTDALLSQRTTALFSLEAFRELVAGRAEAASHLLLPNGSLAVSPAATAFLLSQSPNWRRDYPQSARYIDDLLAAHQGGAPHVAPYDIFLRAWMLTNLHYARLTLQHRASIQPHTDYLLRVWRSEGVGYSSFEPLTDSDDTALAALCLHRAGHRVSAKILRSYERNEHFACYDYEKDPSISANLHVLEALELFPKQDQRRVREKIIGYLLRSRKYGSFWSDKWHVSAYYPTSLALLILSRYIPGELEATVGWIIHTQHPDGGWGSYGSTAEETAMTLIALLHYQQQVGPIDQEALRRAAAYLLLHEQPFQGHYPELWIGKVLYAPVPVIRSTILAALGLYDAVIGVY